MLITKNKKKKLNKQPRCAILNEQNVKKKSKKKYITNINDCVARKKKKTTAFIISVYYSKPYHCVSGRSFSLLYISNNRRRCLYTYSIFIIIIASSHVHQSFIISTAVSFLKLELVVGKYRNIEMTQ